MRPQQEVKKKKTLLEGEERGVWLSRDPGGAAASGGALALPERARAGEQKYRGEVLGGERDVFS